jgi:hypothetical protein
MNMKEMAIVADADVYARAEFGATVSPRAEVTANANANNGNQQQFKNFNGINAQNPSANFDPIPHRHRVTNNMSFNMAMNNGQMHFNQASNQNWNNKVVFIAAPRPNNTNNRRKLGRVRESVNKNSNSRTSKDELFVKKFVPSSSTKK